VKHVFGIFKLIVLHQLNVQHLHLPEAEGVVTIITEAAEVGINIAFYSYK
jgi:hypothetical protein